MTLAEYMNSQFSAMQELDFFLRILTACLCGGCIGLERSKRLKEAGIRTHVIVCCAAALLMIVSKYGFADLTSAAGQVFSGTRGADPARVAAQVVSGISFLGAGIIFKNGGAVKGLTTAAGIWATAGIGLAIGAGMYVVGIFTVITVILLQLLMHRFPVGADALVTSRLQFTVTVEAEEGFQEKLAQYLKKQRVQVVESKISRLENGGADYDLTVRSPHELALEELRFFLEAREVGSVHCAPVG